MRVTFYVLLLALYAHTAAANEMASCVQLVCHPNEPVESLASFLSRENTDHPDLPALIAKYQSRLDSVRLKRQSDVKKALAILQPGLVSSMVSGLDHASALELFVKVQPWNTVKGYQNGKLVVTAQPLFASDKAAWNALIKDLFNRLQAASPLLAAQYRIDFLNATPREALGLTATENIESAVTQKIQSHLAQLPANLQAKIRKQLDVDLPKAKALAKSFGDAAWISIGGDTDLAMAIDAGEVAISDAEASEVRDMLSDELTSRISTLTTSVPNIDVLYRKEKWDAACHKAYNRALHYALTKTESDSLATLKAEAIRRANISAAELFPAMAQRLNDFFKAADISGPMTLPEYEDYTDRQMSAIETAPTLTKTAILEAYELIRGINPDHDGAMGDVCNDFIFSPIRDQESDGRVLLSSYSLKHYNMGLELALHELGHAVSAAMLISSDSDIATFLGFRKCVSLNYAASTRPASGNLQFPGDKQWSEEDWADAFGAHSAQDLKVNDMCPTVGVYPERDYWSIDERDFDPHSPTFYRILAVATYQGRTLPGQCTTALQDEYPGTSFKDCLKMP